MQYIAPNRDTKIRGGVCALLALLVFLAPLPLTGAPLTIMESVELDFGTVVDRNGVVQLGLSDNVLFDPFGIHVGDPVSTGHYLISGDPFATISLSITGSTVSGLSIGSFITSEGTPPLLHAALDITGELDLSLGATVSVNSAQVVPGAGQPLLFTITVNYN
jgi:hypothetical protein